MSWILAEQAPCTDVEMLAYCEDGEYWLVKRDAAGDFWYDHGDGKTLIPCITHVARLLDPPGTHEHDVSVGPGVTASGGGAAAKAGRTV